MIPFDAQALQVSPYLVPVEAEPGDVHETTIQLKNNEQFVQLVRFHVKAFKAGDTEGVPEIIDDTRAVPVGWFQAPQREIALDPGETIPLDIKITIPPDAEPGGYYAAAFAKTRAPENAGVVGSSNEIGVLFFISVAGDVKRAAEVHNLQANTTQWTGLPVAIAFSVKNTGNIHLQPKGIITITNIFSKQQKIITINDENKIILPESQRDLKNLWREDGWWYSPINPVRFGIYEVTLTIDGNEEGVKPTVRFVIQSPAAWILLVLLIVWRLIAKFRSRKL